MQGRRSQLHTMDEIHLIGKLADLKDQHYRQSIMLSAITELLIEKGILTTTELLDRAAHLDLLDSLEAMPRRD